MQVSGVRLDGLGRVHGVDVLRVSCLRLRVFGVEGFRV